MQLSTSAGKIFWLFQSEYREGALGPFVNPDHYAALMKLAIPLAPFEALRDRRRMLPITMMAAAMVASVVAGARGLEAHSFCLIMLLAPRRADVRAMPRHVCRRTGSLHSRIWNGGWLDAAMAMV